MRGNEEKMSHDQDPFDVLEGKINHLITAYDALKAENTVLGEQLTESKAVVQSLEEKMIRLSQERERAKEKVENLLGRLDRLILSNR
jgi:chromosome segregation ATPase